MIIKMNLTYLDNNHILTLQSFPAVAIISELSLEISISFISMKWAYSTSAIISPLRDCQTIKHPFLVAPTQI
jgi:hypothetical protein